MIPTPIQGTPHTLSIEDQEALSVALYAEAKKHLANGDKNTAIAMLREIVRLYPDTRMAGKARSSLKNR